MAAAWACEMTALEKALASNIFAAKIGAAQVGAAEVGLRNVRVAQAAAHEDRFPEVAPGQIRV